MIAREQLAVAEVAIAMLVLVVVTVVPLPVARAAAVVVVVLAAAVAYYKVDAAKRMSASTSDFDRVRSRVALWPSAQAVLVLLAVAVRVMAPTMLRVVAPRHGSALAALAALAALPLATAIATEMSCLAPRLTSYLKTRRQSDRRPSRCSCCHCHRRRRRYCSPQFVLASRLLPPSFGRVLFLLYTRTISLYCVFISCAGRDLSRTTDC